LENIAQNTLITATNAERSELNSIRNYLSADETYGTIPDVAAAYRDAGVPWIVIGDENYGEGMLRTAVEGSQCCKNLHCLVPRRNSS
jgi:aconitate hydratase